MAVHLTPLGNAIAALQRALERHAREPADEEVRDSVIRRFEYTYDLAAKMLRRALAASEDSPGETDRMTFATMIRTAWEKGLTKGGFSDWHAFREDRNKTSHTYKEEIATAVMSRIPAFLEEARFVLARLEKAG